MNPHDMTERPGAHPVVKNANADRLRALEAVEAGSLRLHRTLAYGHVYLTDSRSQHPSPELCPKTVQQLVAEGLLHQDRSEGLYWPSPGQLLSLTPQGEATLRDARTATPRVSAALSRSSAPAPPGALTESATRPDTTVVGNANRSR